MDEERGGVTLVIPLAWETDLLDLQRFVQVLCFRIELLSNRTELIG
jgi:hypothetical protein